MAVEIQIWLTSVRDYPEGVALYAKYGTSEALKRMFAWQHTSYNERKLSEALETLLAVQQQPAVSEDNPVQTPEMLANSIQTTDHQVEPEIRLETLDAKWKPLYKEAVSLHSQLHLLEKNAREIAAFRILDLFDQVQEIWYQKEYLKMHGQLPDAPAPVAPEELNDPLQITKKIQNLSVQISKHKHNAARAAEVAQWETQKLELKRRLSREQVN